MVGGSLVLSPTNTRATNPQSDAREVSKSA